MGVKRQVTLESPLSQWLDMHLGSSLKQAFYSRLEGIVAPALRGIRLREVEQLRETPFPTPFRPKVVLYRGVEAVNWMLRYPWIVDAGHSPTEAMDYYFSDTRPFYRLVAQEIETTAGAYRGFVVLSVSRKANGEVIVRLLDHQLASGLDARLLLAVTVQMGRSYQADILEISAEAAKPLRKHPLGKLLLRRKEPLYQAMPASEDSPLARYWEQIEFQLVDGDMAFS